MSLSSSSASDVGTQRRRPHSKVKTGCDTCRNRRVKCSEEKPECQQCQRADRQCRYSSARRLPRDGALRVNRAFRNSFTSDLSTKLQRRQVSKPLSSTDSRALQYFEERTLPVLSVIYDQKLWSISVKRLARAVPAIQHAVIALGAYQENAELRSSGFDTSSSQENGALAAYIRSVECLRKYMSSQDVDITIVKLSSLLFTLLEFLRGQDIIAVSHLASGIGLSKLHSPTSQDCDEAEIDRILSRMSLAQILYGRPQLDPPANKLLAAGAPAQELPEELCATFTEAHTSIYSLMREVWGFVLIADESVDFETALAMQAVIETRLAQWSTEFEQLASSMSGAVERVRCNLLRTAHQLAYIFLDASVTQFQTSFDRHLESFRRIVTWVQELLDMPEIVGKFSSVFAVDTAIIPALFYTATKCRDAAVRLDAIRLLKRVPRHEGLWDALEAAKCAELVVEFEQRCLHGRPPACGCHIPEEARVHEVDIHKLRPSDNLKQVVVLKWRPSARSSSFRLEHTYIDWS